MNHEYDQWSFISCIFLYCSAKVAFCGGEKMSFHRIWSSNFGENLVWRNARIPKGEHFLEGCNFVPICPRALLICGVHLRRDSELFVPATHPLPLPFMLNLVSRLEYAMFQNFYILSFMKVWISKIKGTFNIGETRMQTACEVRQTLVYCFIRSREWHTQRKKRVACWMQSIIGVEWGLLVMKVVALSVDVQTNTRDQRTGPSRRDLDLLAIHSSLPGSTIISFFLVPKHPPLLPSGGEWDGRWWTWGHPPSNLSLWKGEGNRIGENQRRIFRYGLIWKGDEIRRFKVFMKISLRNIDLSSLILKVLCKIHIYCGHVRISLIFVLIMWFWIFVFKLRCLEFRFQLQYIMCKLKCWCDKKELWFLIILNMELWIEMVNDHTLCNVIGKVMLFTLNYMWIRKFLRT